MDSKEEEEEEDVMVVEIFRSSQEKLKRQKFRFRSLVRLGGNYWTDSDGWLTAVRQYILMAENCKFIT